MFGAGPVAALKRATDFPKVKAWYMRPGTRPEIQIQNNAWEQNVQITVPVEMFRFLGDDPQAFTFLHAHGAGHAKQEEIYGQSCYTARNVKTSKFDWVRARADIAVNRGLITARLCEFYQVSEESPGFFLLNPKVAEDIFEHESASIKNVDAVVFASRVQTFAG